MPDSTMLGSTNIIVFVPTKDPAKARAFYEGTLGLRFVKDDGFAMVLDANGIMVRVSKAEFTPVPFTILGWQVTEIEKMVKALQQKGVHFERFGFSSRMNLGYGPRPPATRWRGSRILMAISCQSPNTSRKPNQTPGLGLGDSVPARLTLQ
jgi:hypothetical protein